MATQIPNGFSQKGSSSKKLTTETDALAVAMGRVTGELNKVENIFNLQPGKDGALPEVAPEDMPHVPGGKLATITAGDEVVFKAPDTTAAEGQLGDLGDKAGLAAEALQLLYDKLNETAPLEAVVAGAAFGPAGESILPTSDGDGEMGMDGDVPLTPEEEIAKLQETEEAKDAIKQESVDKDAALKAKEAELAKKNMLGLIGMTKLGAKATGQYHALNRSRMLLPMWQRASRQRSSQRLSPPTYRRLLSPLRKGQHPLPPSKASSTTVSTVCRQMVLTCWKRVSGWSTGALMQTLKTISIRAAIARTIQSIAPLH